MANFYPQSLPFKFQLPAIFGEVPPARRTFGGTPLGLVFGTIAFLIFLFASALGIRKKKRSWKIGNVQLWLKAHIWLTVLTIPLVLYHCGFHLGGMHSSVLFILYSFVMGSGFFGLALQQFMPRLMKERLAREVVFEQIPFVRARIFESALELLRDVRAASRSELEKPLLAGAALAHPGAEPQGAVVVLDEDPSIVMLTDFLDRECLPYLRSANGKGSQLADQKKATDSFRLLRLSVTERWQSQVNDMEVWCEDRRLMDLQLTMHHWLHGWLFIHVPTSFALLIYTAWHAWVAVRYLVILPH
ncbi:MAG: hypothetical protein JWL90_194 [Chthoniobacteraceae bacterium]|nr:hypothetical protein [Chthoniobacteraceae bacterium]